MWHVQLRSQTADFHRLNCCVCLVADIPDSSGSTRLQRKTPEDRRGEAEGRATHRGTRVCWFLLLSELGAPIPRSSPDTLRFISPWHLTPDMEHLCNRAPAVCYKWHLLLSFGEWGCWQSGEVFAEDTEDISTQPSDKCLLSSNGTEFRTGWVKLRPSRGTQAGRGPTDGTEQWWLLGLGARDSTLGAIFSGLLSCRVGSSQGQKCNLLQKGVAEPGGGGKECCKQMSR